MWREIWLTCLFVGMVRAYSQGAPDTTCNTLLPGHGLAVQSSKAPFIVIPSATEITGGQRIRITLQPTDGGVFKGFLIQGRDSQSNQVVGTFFTEDHNYLTCSAGFSNTVTHSNSLNKGKIELDWEPPSDYEGEVFFITTFLRNYTTYWTGITSEKITIVKPATIAFPAAPSGEVSTEANTAAATTTATTTTTTPTTTSAATTEASTSSSTTQVPVSNEIGLFGTDNDVIEIVDAPNVGLQNANASESTGLPALVSDTDNVVSLSNGSPSISTGSSDFPSNSSPDIESSTPEPEPVSPRASTVSFGILRKATSTPKPIKTTTTTTTTSEKPSGTTEPTTEEQTNLAAALNSIYLGCSANKGCFGLPKNCIKRNNCKSLVTYTKDNSGGYQFELMGTSNVGYVAAGISKDEFMGEDSVMACRNLDGVIDVTMAWNDKGVKSNSLLFDKQLDLSNIEVGEIDGKFICRFLREKRTEINGILFNLDEQRLHVMNAYGNLKADGNLLYHTERSASNRPISLAQFKPIETVSELFKLLHACFMIGAWIGTASCGIILARYYKKTWMSSQCCGIDQWFHWHRFFMGLTWLLTMAGIGTIVYYLKRWSTVDPSENPHAIVGVISAGLCFIQPFMAMCRPAPDAKNRPLFNWFHWGVGNLAQILGIVAIFFGLDLFGGIPQWSWWIVIVFVAFHCVMHLILSIGQCISDSRTKKSRDVYPLKNMSNSRDPLNPVPPERRDAPGGVFRKMMLAFYLLINWAFTAVLILVVIFGEDQLREWNLLFWEQYY